MPDAQVPAEAQVLAKRRSHRLLLDIPVRVRGKNLRREFFNEDTHSLVVNAHGGLIVLAAVLRVGDMITLRNMVNGEQLEAFVVFLGPMQEGKREVGFEFRKPSLKFWGVSFPPADWITPPKNSSGRT